MTRIPRAADKVNPAASRPVPASRRSGTKPSSVLSREIDDRRNARERIRLQQRVDKETERLLVNAEARKRMTAISHGRHLPDLNEIIGKTFRDELDEPEPEVEYAIDSLARDGAVVTMPSSRKTGKTTLLANLGADGLGERPFLGKFDTHLDTNSGLVVINAEMNKADYRGAWRDLDPGYDHPRFLREQETGGSYIDPYDRLKIIHCRPDNIRINLMNDDDVKWLVELCYYWNAGWLFLDPWKNFCSWAGIGISDNDGINDLAARLVEIQAAAELSLLVVAMHTPQVRAEEGEERGKGAGELEDAADALWRYTKVGSGGSSAPRFLSVVGRGCGLEETEIHFDPFSSRLSLGSGNRHDAEQRGDERRLLANLTEAQKELSTSELYGSMNRNRATEAKRRLVAAEEIVMRKEGQKEFFSLPGKISLSSADSAGSAASGADRPREAVRSVRSARVPALRASPGRR